MTKFKFGEEMLVPHEALALGHITTMDGVKAFARVSRGMDEGECLLDLEWTSRRLYHMPFRTVRTIWSGRLGVGRFSVWHLIKMSREDDR